MLMDFTNVYARVSSGRVRKEVVHLVQSLKMVLKQSGCGVLSENYFMGKLWVSLESVVYLRNHNDKFHDQFVAKYSVVQVLKVE